MGRFVRVSGLLRCLCLAALACCGQPAAETEATGTTHTDTAPETTKEQYTTYFSDSTYAAPSPGDVAGTYIHSDQDFILALLGNVALLTAPAALHGVALSFETCPAVQQWSGDFTRDLQVPSEYPTIQAAIDAAVDYQSIIIDPSGTYQENLTIQNKFINLFSASASPVVLTPVDPSIPTILLNCGGGGMVGGFALEGGTVGIKASTTSLGWTTIVNSTLTDIVTPIVLIDTHFFIVDNVIAGTTDGIILVQATGDLHQNTIHGGTGIAVYLDTPQGVTISENTFTQEAAGQGAIFMNGGVALVKNNTLTLTHNAFGIFSQYATAETGAGLEVLDNTLSAPKALGLTVFGGTGNTTQAYLAGNTVTDTVSAQSDTGFAWLANYGEGNTFVDGNGMIVLDAAASAIGNTTTGNAFIGLGFARSCGTLTGNTSTANQIFDLVTKTFPDDDNCTQPTLGTNTYTTILDDNSASGETLGVSDAPIEVPVP